MAVVDATRASFCDTGESGGDDVGGALHDENVRVVSHMILPGPVRRYFCVARTGWGFQIFLVVFITTRSQKHIPFSSSRAALSGALFRVAIVYFPVALLPRVLIAKNDVSRRF